ncbi:MAG TPA: hypothetical protein DEF45_22340 [Rhodopirellula sp.]|nr:MAG: hypothetical protein CBD74_07055 [Saprospirales bacterium TMED214]HBV65752.1 hypothetical protein [Rhodopirellula sp.]
MRNLTSSIKTISWVGILIPLVAIYPSNELTAQAPVEFSENFNNFDPSRFQTTIPNRNSRIREGVLWTRGDSGGKYPPMIHLDLNSLKIETQDLKISFRFRFLQPDSFIWFFIDGADGFGSVDHLLRVKLLPTGVQLQIDSHSRDPNHPDRVNKDRPADKLSGAYRLSQRLPKDLVELKLNQWHDVKVAFRNRKMTISVGGQNWSKTIRHACFNTKKHKLLWMQKGGDQGIEIDDLKITQVTVQR